MVYIKLAAPLLRCSRENLLSGISRTALAIPLAFMTAQATASTASTALPSTVESVFFREFYGAQGSDATARTFSANTPATPGLTGGIIMLLNDYTTRVEHGVAVQLGSMGGVGGVGASAPFAWEPGARGGDGGRVSVVQRGALAGYGDQPTRAAEPLFELTRGSKWYSDTRSGAMGPWWNGGGAMMLIYSQGGRGGGATSQAGRGGDGGEVDVWLQSSIKTEGRQYSGIWARSLGGDAAFGGIRYGGLPSVLAGGNGGVTSVIIDKSGSIGTKGASAPGIIAESIGGEGSSATLYYGDYNATNGGAGGAVWFDNSGTISTVGDRSLGVILQSAGGNGGSQRRDEGGNGGSGGVGGWVLGINQGLISTNGKYSTGLMAQSIGGTGGRGGDGLFHGNPGGAAGAGGDVNIGNFGKITTKGEGATGIAAQSVGGGNAIAAFQAGAIVPGSGGSGAGGAGGAGDAWFFGRGGEGGSGGAGGNIHVTQLGTIETDGLKAYGLVAQSIGGGGGIGGMSSVSSPFVGIGLGGDGGGGGAGGNVLVDGFSNAYRTSWDKEAALGDALRLAVPASGPSVAPSITTIGAGSTGLIAMSVGGGGGLGGSATAKAAGVVAALTVAVGGKGGGGGNGGNVEVNNESAITTFGIQSAGIIANSVGGGGGIAGDATSYALAVAPPEWPAFSLSFAVGGAGGTGGTGGSVTVRNYGNIITTGSSSDGIDALSVGGGGGNGGVAKSAADVVGFFENVTLVAAVGGKGGGGGNGYTDPAKGVRVENYAAIETSGAFSRGISAMSIGGGGGHGGSGDAKASSGISWNDHLNNLVSALPTAGAMTTNFAIGGAGGEGGHGGRVDVDNSGTILTQGHNAKGIHAQSVGGGGGDAGGYMATGKGKFNITLEAGGDAGHIDPAHPSKNRSGGNGGAVTVTNQSGGVIRTIGAGSVGIFAQSVGGGGGEGGGFAGTVKAAPTLTEDTGAFILQLVDEVVKVNDLRTYVTKMATSKPDPADKKADVAKASGDKVSEEDKKNALAAIANANGKNDKPGDAKGPDRIKQAKSLFKIAKSFYANGKKLWKVDKDGNLIFPESGEAFNAVSLISETILVEAYKDKIKKAYEKVYGEAEKPTELDLTVALGGKGGAGGAGDAVEVTNSGLVFTEEANSIGILAQSIGGGGGRAGASLANGTNKLNANISVGGSGGDGGKGGNVTVANTNGIQTAGAGSFGLFAQSVGGGGGYGGVAASANSISLTGELKVGGSGGKSSNGGSVKVDNSGTILTSGKEAHALIAQSVGGGGGTVFVSRVDPDDPAVVSDSADMKEAMQLAEEMLKAATTSVLTSRTTTEKEKSDAQKLADLLAYNSSGAKAGGTGDVSSTILPTPSIGASFGGTGGEGGSGGKVFVNHSGSIVTEGIGSFGIFAQSVGGGGGFGADAGNDGLLAIKARLGGTGGVGGNGDEVKVTFDKNASVATSGNGATAVTLQSIGGGGGYTGAGNVNMNFADPLPVEKTEQVWVPPTIIPTPDGGVSVPGYWITRTSTQVLGSSGNGGAIIVGMADTKSRLSITTTGNAAHGIYAQTIGGGGGAAFQTTAIAVQKDEGKRREGMTGHGGSVSIITHGDIVTTGEGSHGFFIQNGRQTASGSFEDFQRQSGANIIDHTGILTGGTGSGTAIRVEGGGTTTINLRAGAMVSAGSGNAIQTSVGSDSLTNAGVLMGNVDLASSGTLEKNTFRNESSAAYISAPGNGIVNLGRGGSFENFGVIDVGGLGKLGTLNINGGDAWLAGVARVDIDSSGPGVQKNDWIEANGVATIDGLAFQPNFIGVLPTPYTLMSGELVQHNPAEFSYSAASPISWQTRSSTSNITVTPSADFAAAASGIELTPTERSFMNSLQDVWNAGTGSTYASRVFGGMASVSSLQEYEAALASGSPEGQQQAAIVQSTTGSRASLRGALSCPAFIDDGVMINESECAWARISSAHWNQSESTSTFGYSQNSFSYRMGAQWEFKPNWFVGASGAYTSSKGHSDDGFTETESDSGDIAISLKHQMGAWYFAGAAHLGYGRITTDRIFSMGNDLWFAEVDSDVWTAAVRGRVAYEFAFDQSYVRPYLDVDIIHTYMPGYELNGDGARLAADAFNDWTFALSPAVELGTRIDVAKGWLRPYGTVGFTYLHDEQMSQNFLFGGENGDGFAFVSTSAAPEFLVDVGLGLQLYVDERYELRGEYNAQIGDNFLGQEGSVRFAVKF
ncbi:autotransporter outer membrane beta-barrel domain-containing protein [Ochrobactrum sp. EDr1-4]|uniref:autotransporter outer membrane beta-barrel domain-containing protein n=1 Tax=Ochrobactrum sp. EDr1-4 TaxID=3368622 RepID=UPI003B9FE990